MDHEGDFIGSLVLELSKSIIGLIPQQKASVLADAIQNDLLNIIAADTAESIDVLIFPLKRSLEELSEISQGLSERAKKRLVKQVGIFESLTVGPNSLPQVRKDELAVVAQAEELLVS